MPIFFVGVEMILSGLLIISGLFVFIKNRRVLKVRRCNFTFVNYPSMKVFVFPYRHSSKILKIASVYGLITMIAGLVILLLTVFYFYTM
jgi:hypothetical protein